MAEELILDAHLGLTNIIGKKEVSTIMVDTLIQLKDALSDHAGPYSEFATITDLNDPSNIATHTKDGINIVRHIHYASPMQEFIRRTLMYIGDKAENSAGDATTASMIMTAAAMEYLLKSDIISQYTFSELINQFDIFINNIDIAIKKRTYTIDKMLEITDNTTDKDVSKFISYCQAYTSSHGDTSLADIISQIFGIMPEESWNYIGCQRSRFETDTRLSIDWDNSQYSMNSEIFKPTMLNKMSGTQYVSDNADLIVLPYEISESFFPIQEFRTFLKKYENDKDLIILMPSGCPGNFYMEIESLIKNKNRIVIFQHYNAPGIEPNLEGVCLVSGYKRESLIDTLVVVRDVKCTFKYKVLSFDGLYDNPDNSIIHPNAKTGYLAKQIEELKTHIDLMAVEINGMESSNTIQTLKKYYLKLLLTRRPVIRIGGNSHDNSTLIDIVKDTICAVSSTLKHGFTFTQNVTLYNALCELQENLPLDDSRELHKVLIDAFIDSIDVYRECLFKHRKKKDNFNKKFNKLGMLFDFFLPIEENDEINTLIKNDSYDEFIKRQFNSDSPIVIQPGNVDTQLISRFGEVALKFLKSNKILVPNSVMLNANK